MSCHEIVGQRIIVQLLLITQCIGACYRPYSWSAILKLKVRPTPHFFRVESKHYSDRFNAMRYWYVSNLINIFKITIYIAFTVQSQFEEETERELAWNTRKYEIVWYLPKQLFINHKTDSGSLIKCGLQAE